MMIKKILFRFLKERGLEKIFFKRCRNIKFINFNDFEIFNTCITWDYTNEGYNYWKYTQLEYLIILYHYYEIYGKSDEKEINFIMIKNLFIKIKNFSTYYSPYNEGNNTLYEKKIKNIYNTF